MQQTIDIPRHLKLRFLSNQTINSNGLTSTAVFQFVVQGTEEFAIQINDVCCIQFAAFYKYNNNMYEHPFSLYTNSNNNSRFEFEKKGVYNIPLFLKLKRLRDFNENDWKNYYRTIDENLGSTVNFSDFHDVYLKIYYYHNDNQQWNEYLCNDSLPIHLPKFISNLWTQTNTLFRFRYDAENRDDVFPCQMQLLHYDTTNTNSYKIVLCLATNTIPARMDFHSIRWTCKLKPRSNRRRGRLMTAGGREKLYQLHHLSGVIVAKMFGLDLVFTPRIQWDHIKSCYEPDDFVEMLQNSDIKDNDGLTIGVIKETDYPKIVTMRRTDKTIRRYIPFNEINDMDNNLEGGDKEIIKRLKLYKKECYKQLILYDKNEKKTYNQAHVRLYVAAYDENDVLFAEILYPPLRDSKKFQQLEICKIVQSKFELHSGDKAFIYCIYDSDKSKTECPYIIELAFSTINDKLDGNQLLEMFEKQRINTEAFYVDKCTNLLEFQVPNEPMYHKNRVFVRIQHKSSFDYNPSPPALNDDECWIYYADENFVTDDFVAAIMDEIDVCIEIFVV